MTRAVHLFTRSPSKRSHILCNQRISQPLTTENRAKVTCGSCLAVLTRRHECSSLVCHPTPRPDQ